MQTCRTIIASTALSAALLSALPAQASPSYEPDHTWNGTYWGISLRTGLGVRASGDNALSPSVGLGLRLSQIMNFFEAELFFDYGLPTEEFQRSRLGIDFRLRPFFMDYLQNTFFSDLRSSIYLSLGAGADFASYETTSEAAFAFSLGTGLDIPLSNPRKHDPSWALSLDYRFRFAGFDEMPEGFGNGNEHLVLLTLGIRFNGLSFAHIPNPTELHDHGNEL